MSATLDNFDRPSWMARELEWLAEENELLRKVAEAAKRLMTSTVARSLMMAPQLEQALADWEEYDNDTQGV